MSVAPGSQDAAMIRSHPTADLFPPLDDVELAQLALDIHENGLRDPIVLHPDGSILDGRNRYHACLKAKVKPQFKTWDGQPGAEFVYVISVNLHRRHLSESQRAMIGSKIAAWKLGDNQHKGGSANLPTQFQAAEMLNVSERSVRAAAKIRSEAPPEIIQAVERGEVSVSRAAAAMPTKKSRRPSAEVAATGHRRAFDQAMGMASAIEQYVAKMILPHLSPEQAAEARPIVRTAIRSLRELDRRIAAYLVTEARP